MKSFVITAAVLLLAAGRTVASTPAYYRYPDLHGNQVVFAAEADLWIAPAEGGAARRLTTHPGGEAYPAFSPDGAWIAFSGQYDGNLDVYVLSAAGGEPRRLTWHPGPDEVVGWTPEGTHVLFRSGRAEPNGTPEMYRVPVQGGDPEKLPLGWAARLDIDPKTGLWVMNRESLENATWKRYRGGTAADVWVGNPERGFKQVTTFEGNNSFPMWHGGRIYYLCDRGGTVNLWSMDAEGKDQKRHTDLKNWDARWPGMAPDGRIVFTAGADLRIFDPRDETVKKVEVDLPSDRKLTRNRYPNAGQYVSGFDITPDGDRLVVETRGELFSVPVKDGVTLPVTAGSGARESRASFDGEGKRLIYVTDAPGEEEIRIQDAWGRGTPTVVKPAGKSGRHFMPILSPDGKQVAYGDETQGLYVMPTEGGAPKRADRSREGEITNYSWSADSRWLAYSKVRDNTYSGIFVYDTKDGAIHEITGPSTDDYSPAWDPEGRYLYFLSHRHTNPFLGSVDWDNIEAKNTRPHIVLLRKDVKNPLADLEGLPPDDKDKDKEKDTKKDEDKKDEKKDDAKGKDDEKKAPEPITIDFEGILDRTLALDVPIGSYYGLAATAKHVYYVSVPVKGFAESAGLFEEEGPENTLMVYDLEKKKAKPFVEGMENYALAVKGEKLAVMKAKGEIYVVDSGSPPSDLSESKVDLANLVIELEPQEEWKQIYWEAWRNQRDFFWDAGMGGHDWRAVGDQYASLLPRVASRSDLQDLLGQLIGELNNSHTYVWGGDPGVSVPQVSVGLLGADVVREGDAYRVARIYRGDPADNVTTPLRMPGADLKEGDFILALNHRPFEAGRSFYSFFEGWAGKEVVLTVNSRNSKEGARDVVVATVGSEANLRYADWVRRNREYVAEKTGGKIGYVHLPDMWKDGLIEWNTWFFSQLDKEGMVVDVRWNGGGAVSQMIVERLRRQIVSFDRARQGGLSTYPYKTLNGPFVVLTNEQAGSDGDIFPAVIQREKLAPVIGMRSWGGVVGIRGGKPTVDGGSVTQPEFAWWEAQGGWTIENHGVDPDIVVDNLPQDLARGVDTQLDRGIQEVMRLHAERPPIVPEFGPVRGRTRQAFQKELEGMK